MNNYSNPLVTYDEIVEALTAIIDYSKANGYIEEYGFLNAKYDSINTSPLQKEQEEALLQALQSLEKTIIEANKGIRKQLEQALEVITSENIFKIKSLYEQNQELRKLSSNPDLVIKLKEMSLPLELLNKVEKNDQTKKEALVDDLSKIDISKIQLIKTALEKARKSGNEELANTLEKQLLKELEKLD